MDISVTPANVAQGSNAIIGTGTAGETILAGKSIYKDTSDGKYKLADADAAATAEAAGIALNGASDTQPIDFVKFGDIDPGGTVVVGELYMVSKTAGGIAPITDLGQGDYATVLGIGTTASNIKIKIVTSGVAAGVVSY